MIVETTEYKCLQSQFSVLYNESLQMKTLLDESRNLVLTNKNAHLRQIEQMEVCLEILTSFSEISLNSLPCLVEDKQFMSTLILCNTFYPVFLSCISLDLKCIPDIDMVRKIFQTIGSL